MNDTDPPERKAIEPKAIEQKETPPLTKGKVVISPPKNHYHRWSWVKRWKLGIHWFGIRRCRYRGCDQWERVNINLLNATQGKLEVLRDDIQLIRNPPPT